jgi:CubicO group peptidase (beta-lactamase class C family)
MRGIRPSGILVRLALSVLLVTIGWAAARVGAATQAAGSAAALDALVDSIVHAEALSRHVPALGVAIVADGRVVIRRAYGLADVSAGRAATVATTFNIASVTKPFTAAVVLRLASERRVDLDGPVRRYLPSLPERYATVTVRQLLTHTSGIARDMRQDNFDDPDAATYLARLAAAAPSGTPGARYEYSNAGYTVLGWLVEAVEGLPLADVFRRRIFQPLSMPHAGYRIPIAQDPGRARPYRVAEGTTSPETYLTGGFGSGGISMSVTDFAAFAVGLQGGLLIPGPFLEEAWRPARLADGTAVELRMFDAPASYGFGWFLTRFAGRQMVTHGGAIEGYSANLYHFPDDRLTIALVANVKGRNDGAAPVDAAARRLAEL